MSCSCVNIDIQTYDNQELCFPPWRLKPVGIDRCIIPEIKYLWKLGIKTIGCCCGHNKLDSFVQVEDKYIPKMISLGYELEQNKHGAYYFICKSLKA